MRRRYHSCLFVMLISLLIAFISCSGDSSPVAVTEIALDSTTLEIEQGGTAKITAAVLPENASDKSLLWSSSDEDAVSVNNGDIIAAEDATADTYTITVSSVSNPDVKAECTVTVTEKSVTGGGAGGGGSSPSEETPSIEIDASNDLASSDSGSTAISKKIDVIDTDAIVEITGLVPGELYSLYPDTSVSESPSTRSLYRASSQPTAAGSLSYVFTVPEGQTSYQFRAKDIGLSAGQSFMVGKIGAKTVDFTDGTYKMEIGEGITDSLYERNDGEKYYEGYFKIDVAKLTLDLENIVLLSYRTGHGSISRNYDYGIVDKYGNSIGINDMGVIDISEQDTVYLYINFTLSYSESEENQGFGVMLANPIELTREGKELTAPNVYMIGPTDRCYLRVSANNDFYLGWTDFINDLSARYCDTGERHPLFFPVEVTNNSILMNIEQTDKPFIFDYDATPSNNIKLTAQLVDITDENSVEVESILVDPEETIVTIELPQHERFVPFIFTGNERELAGCTLSFTSNSDEDGMLKICASNSSGIGRSVRTQELGHSEYGGPIEYNSNHILEYGYFLRTYDNDYPQGSITLTITH